MGPTLTKATPARSPGYVDDELAAVRKLRRNSKSQKRGEIVANGHSGSSCRPKPKDQPSANLACHTLADE
jgi:hypothetical protein